MTIKGGPVAVTGAKTDGIESMLRDLRRFNLVEEVVSKAHGKAVLLRVPENIPLEIRGWTSALEIQPNKDGFATSAAMFSADSPDEGSTLLCPFIGDLSGRVADLGAGWGYLASESAKSAKLSEVHLFEAEYRAIEAARQNVKDPRAVFHWLDISEIEDRGFDAVVCNPPFHVSRTADPDIGRNFIKVAARILKPNGSFLLVANRQLPYEAVLSQCFRIVRSLKETNKYKVIQATGVAK
jgi:16S rRNA (guanine1207-N2)-methyltransferase